MTTVFIFADPSDGRIRSWAGSYNNAKNGSGLDIDDTSINFGTFGQNYTGGGLLPYIIYQYFTRFIGAFDPDTVITSAYFRFTGSIVAGSPNRHLEVRQFAWGSVINESDWASPSELQSALLLGQLRGIQNMGNGQTGRVGSFDLTEQLKTPGGISTVNVTNQQRAESQPSGEEFNQYRTAEYSGTSSDPALVYTEVPLSTLERFIGAQVQLSDGTHAFLQHNAQLHPNNTTLVRHHDGTSISTIGTINNGTLGGDWGRGTQAATMVRDASDNIYVIGRQNSSQTDLVIVPYIKGSGHSWSAGTNRIAAMPGYPEPINNVAAAWHSVGSGGTIVVVISHQAGRNSGVEMSYALMNCNHILTGSGSLLRDSGSAHGAKLTDNGTRDGFHNFQNETGTLMDMVAAPGTGNRGFFISTGYGHVLGDNNRLYLSRYQLSSNGSSFDDVDGSFGSWGIKDANAKARIIGLSTSQFITVTTDSASPAGIVVQHRQNIGTSSSFSLLSSVGLADEGIASMPPAATTAVSNNWDAIYDINSNFVWVYYFDVADGNRLMRTHIDLNSGQSAQDEVEVSAAVGAGGSTNHAIRVHRGAKIGDRVLITVANETSGGTHSTIYILDDINIEPTQPTLVSRSNFDAGNAVTFEWSFNDPNTVDAQSAYQIEIDRVSDGVNVFDSGKTVSGTTSHLLTASTLANEEDYRWRVRTWDEDDAESPYSGYSTFSTTAAGLVTIVDPIADNPPDQNVSSYTIEWTVTGTTQEEYRAKMLVNATDEVILDTDWVLSTDTTLLINNIPSDVEVRFEVQVRSSGVASVAGTRLYTTSYATPPVPEMSLEAVPNGGYILIGVTNPPPEGDIVQVETNDILRRRIDSEPGFTKIASVEVDGQWRDYTALAHVEYEYVVLGRAFSGDNLSETGLATLRLRGIWIHNPNDPQASVKHYPYGNSSGGLEITVEQQARRYQGRQFPMVDYGEGQDDVMSVALSVIRDDPYYPDSGNLISLIMFSEARQVLMVRDGFGRGVIGSIEGFQEVQAAPEIHNVSFAVRRMHREIETVEV